jgi:hypothetical protein
MKEWRVYAKDRTDHNWAVIIWWPEWDEREAKAWFKEHSTEHADHFYGGMTLELVEFETKEERIEKERDRYRDALERITLTEPIGEVAYRIAREALNPTGSSPSGE